MKIRTILEELKKGEDVIVLGKISFSPKQKERFLMLSKLTLKGNYL